MLINRALQEGEYSTDTILKDFTVLVLSPTHPPTHPPTHRVQQRIRTASFSSTQPTHPPTQASLRDDLLLQYGGHSPEAYMSTFRAVRQAWMAR